MSHQIVVIVTLFKSRILAAREEELKLLKLKCYESLAPHIGVPLECRIICTDHAWVSIPLLPPGKHNT